MIGNGEIYNYVELTRDFQLEGALATGSDFEPLLHLYAREGEKAFERLRGMYALCLIGGDAAPGSPATRSESSRSTSWSTQAASPSPPSPAPS